MAIFSKDNWLNKNNNNVVQGLQHTIGKSMVTVT